MMEVLPKTTAPAEQLRITRLIFSVVTGAALVFTLVIMQIDKTGLAGPDSLKRHAQTISFAATACAVILVLAGTWRYNKLIAAAKGSLIPLTDKLNRHRSALLQYLAFCEAAVFGLVIAVTLTNYSHLFAVAGFVIAAMALKLPLRSVVVRELALDWKEQQELYKK